MANRRQILKRRKTVQNIRKITRTMEMVSTARYRRLQNQVTNLRAYTDALNRITINVINAAEEVSDLPLLTPNDSPREIMIVMAGNRGMCGGFNGGVLRLARNRLLELQEDDRPVDLYAYGKKAMSFFRFRGIPVARAAEQFESGVDVEAVSELADELIEAYVKQEVGRVTVAFATFVSSAVQEPNIMTLLPLGQLGRAPTLERKPEMLPSGAAEQYEFLPQADAILEELLPRTVSIRLYQAFLDSLAGEQVARMTAMRLATENAEEMNQNLTMEYNRQRQSTITTELAEIVTGVEAMG